MNKHKCEKCGSDLILITTDGEGQVFAKTCLSCGYEFESKKFKEMMKRFNDPEFEIDYKEFKNKT